MQRRMTPHRSSPQQTSPSGKWHWYSRIWIFFLIVASREVTILTFSPVYGFANDHDPYGLVLEICMLLLGWFGFHFLGGPRSFTLYRLVSTISILGCSIPTLISLLSAYSGTLGPEWGPRLTLLLVTLPLTLACLIYGAHSVSQQVGCGKASGWPMSLLFLLSMTGYITILLFQVIAHRLLQGALGIALLYLGRYGMQAVLSCLYATLGRSRSALITLPLLCCAIFSPRIPLRTNIPRLNSHLEAEGYAVVDRQESLTGYISVLDNLKDGFRVLRCDHSLLGGEWTRYPPSYAPKLNDPVYAIFLMLEAVRLVAENKTASPSLRREDHQKQALVM